jgi:hypothetical protein
MTEDKKSAPGLHSDEEGMSEAEIDRNLKETFPASDPPSWTLGTDHRKESQNESSGENDESLSDAE